MIETDKISTDRRSRISSPSLPSLSTSSDVSSIHARSTPKIAAGIIATVIAIACVIGIAFYFVSTETTPRSESIKIDRISSSQPHYISFDKQKSFEKFNSTPEPKTEENTIIIEERVEEPNIPFFQAPILRNHLRTKYTDGQDPEGPLQEDQGVYYNSRELITERKDRQQGFYISTESSTTTSTLTTTAARKTTFSSILSKRTRFVTPTPLSTRTSTDFKPFIPYSNLNRDNYSEFGARRRGFIRENINNPLIRRRNGLETISTVMDRRPGRHSFHPNGPIPQDHDQNYTLTIDSEYRKDKDIDRKGTEDNVELRKGLISNIYQLVGNARSEMNPSEVQSKTSKQQSSRGEHPESIFARFITKFRNRLINTGPWASSTTEDDSDEGSFVSREFNHHSTSSLLFISLGILLMNALSRTKEESTSEDRSFDPSILELESLFQGLNNDTISLAYNSSSHLGFPQYLRLLQNLNKMKPSEKPVGVDCIWQKYCIELNSLSYSDDSLLKFLARLNSVGIKLIMSQIQGYELLSQFRESYKAWQPIPCVDIFKLCDAEMLSDLEKRSSGT